MYSLAAIRANVLIELATQLTGPAPSAVTAMLIRCIRDISVAQGDAGRRLRTLSQLLTQEADKLDVEPDAKRAQQLVADGLVVVPPVGATHDYNAAMIVWYAVHDILEVTPNPAFAERLREYWHDYYATEQPDGSIVWDPTWAEDVLKWTLG